MLDDLVTWQMNGSKPTIDEFRELDPEERQDVIDFIREFSIYEEVTVAGKDYLLVHAGLGNYSPEKDIAAWTPGKSFIHKYCFAETLFSVVYFCLREIGKEKIF